MFKLRQELQLGREKGENDIIIKYIKGNSTIIKLNTSKLYDI